MEPSLLADIRRAPGVAPPSLGLDINLDFTAPEAAAQAWGMLRQEVAAKRAGGTVALIDNTTAVNAISLLDSGLPEPGALLGDWAWATLLPDLMTLVFGLTHFDRLLVISLDDREVADQRLRKLIDWCGGAVEVFPGSRIPADGMIALDLGGKFDRVQHAFFDRADLHERWRRTWSTLMRGEVDDPFPFTIRHVNVTKAHYRTMQRHMEHTLLRSPKHPLQQESVLGAPRVPPLPSGGGPYRGVADFTDAESRAIYASYHTFRGMFYHALAEYLDAPYLPCAARQVVTHVLPIFDETKLEPSRHATFLRSIDTLRVDDKPLRVALPALRISPTLAAFLKRALEAKGEAAISPKHWRTALKNIRDDSERYRRVIARLLESFVSGDMVHIEKVFSEVGVPAPELIEQAGSVIEAATDVIAANYEGAAGKFWKLLAQKPWETMSRLRARWRLSFILDAREVARRALAVEEQARKIWGRGFVEAERRFLAEFANLPARR
jgi:hypothetical protein